MRTIVSFSLITILLLITNLPLANAQDPAPAAAADKPKPTGLVLNEDTPVKLRLMQNLTSAKNRVNDKVEFEVIEPVKIGDTVVIEQGAAAIATVTKAEPKKSFGRAGKLDVNIDYVRLVNNEKVNLRAVKGGSGGSRTGLMTGAVVATAIVFFPAAPLFFFMKGKNIEIPKGTEITAFTAAATPVNLATQNVAETSAGPTAAAEIAAVAPETSTAANADFATVLIKSDPAGADITIDEKFMGTTQSSIKLSAGEHTITITKAGYKEWKRTITVGQGSEITLDAVMEKVP